MDAIQKIEPVAWRRKEADGWWVYYETKAHDDLEPLYADQTLASKEAELVMVRSALNAMLTHMGMDEDEWNKPTFDQARAALRSVS